MNINKAGIDLIKRWEGLYLKAYYDAVGVITIGYGITNSDKAITGVKIKPGMKISKATAERWLIDSLNKKYAPKVEKYQKKYNFNENQFSALVSFAYNIGNIDGLTNNGKRSIAEIEKKILEYNKAGGKVLKGLADRRKDELKLFKTPVKKVIGNKTLLKKLNQYHAYIKAHSKYFYNKYDGKMTTFGKAKAKVEKKQKVGLTCVVALRWALAYMGIKGKGGKSLISAPKGSFASYYTGDVKKYLTRIKKGDPVGMTPKQAIDKGLLDPGDIVCYKGRTHTSVYTGSGYIFVEGGGTCSKNGHYPNGIKVNYSKGFYADKKISEVLRWKNQDYVKPKNKKVYTGKLPTFSKDRSYYKRGDGIDTLVSCRDQIKIMQKCLNWALSGTNGFEKLKEDGLLGNASRAAILKFRKIYKLSEKAAWTAECNAKMKVIKK